MSIGEKPIGKAIKLVAQICEFDNWEKYTNHGNRVSSVIILINSFENKYNTKDILNHCKYKSVHSQLPYNRRNPVSTSDLRNKLSIVKEISTITFINIKSISTVTSQDPVYKSDKIVNEIKIFGAKSRFRIIMKAK